MPAAYTPSLAHSSSCSSGLRSIAPLRLPLLSLCSFTLVLYSVARYTTRWPIMSIQTLSTPTKSGTSRFSKALPGVPDPTLSKSVPDLPLKPKAKELPPPPPPPHIELAGIENFDTPEIAISSPPLPPPKSTSRPTTPAKQATQMMIPRKAIGQMKPPASPQQPEPSPTVSVSSILSAYGRSFDSPLKSADDTATSWSLTSSVTSPADTEDPYDRKLPALPPKDSPQSTTPSRAELPGSDIPTVTSPTRSELWRRRPQNSLSGREISDLQLQSSNGATAPNNGPSELMGSKPSSEARKPIAKKLPGLGGLPGRNIRPGLAKEQAPEPAVRTTGAASANQRPTTSERPTTGPGSNRPPTPEYRKGDGRAPSLTNFAQPASPPKSPTKTAADAASSKQLPPEPPKDDFKLTTEAPRRKPIGSPETGSSFSTEKPQIIPQSASSTTNGSIVTARTSQSGSSADQQRNSNDGAKFPAREGSLQAQPPRRPMEQMRRPPSAENDPRIVMSDTQGPMYKGRDGTLYPEMKVTRQPDSRALYFPTWKTQPLDKDAIISSVSLKTSHYNCFHKHKIMNRRSNRNHPLRCQTCDIADSQDRWSCTFCHLRICESCLQVFNSNQRDLTQLVNQVSPPNRVSL